MLFVILYTEAVVVFYKKMYFMYIYNYRLLIYDVILIFSVLKNKK